MKTVKTYWISLSVMLDSDSSHHALDELIAGLRQSDTSKNQKRALYVFETPLILALEDHSSQQQRHRNTNPSFYESWKVKFTSSKYFQPAWCICGRTVKSVPSLGCELGLIITQIYGSPDGLNLCISPWKGTTTQSLSLISWAPHYSAKHAELSRLFGLQVTRSLEYICQKTEVRADINTEILWRGSNPAIEKLEWC